MEEKERERVLEKLKALGRTEEARLVLSIARSSESPEPPIDPTNYKSATAYRAALIELNTKRGKAALNGLAERFRNQALKVSEGYLLNALVIEGSLEQLSEAMAEPEVVDAIPDFPLAPDDVESVTTDE